MTRCTSDPCVYFNQTREIIIAVYVDDILMFGKRSAIDAEKTALSQEFDTHDLGRATHVQSIRIRYSADGMHLDKTAYADSILRLFQMTECNPAKTPLSTKTKLMKATKENALDDNDASRYRTLMGSVLYLATSTRPDLAKLSQFNSAPSKEHWAAAKQILRYLKGTKDMMLTYRKNKQALQMFVDAD